jgi:RNAse (barnase) inhibitor barstar
MADKNVRPGEVKKLQDDVRTYWLNLDALQDEFGTDAAYQIEIVFDWLKNEEKDSDTYFEEFTDFYKEHSEIFTPNIKSLVIRTCNDIAASFAGKNKSELILLARLQTLFNNH